jgi:hypothetical protein
MVTTQQEYDATVFQQQEQRRRLQKSARLHAQARELGFHLVPINAVSKESRGNSRLISQLGDALFRSLASLEQPNRHLSGVSTD